MLLTSIDIVRDLLVLAATLRPSTSPARLTSVTLREGSKKGIERSAADLCSTRGRWTERLTLIFLFVKREGRWSAAVTDDDEGKRKSRKRTCIDSRHKPCWSCFCFHSQRMDWTSPRRRGRRRRAGKGRERRVDGDEERRERKRTSSKYREVGEMK